MGEAPLQMLRRPGGPQPLALNAKERDFVERIDHTQSRIELQTIDDADRIAEMDMLGPQVSMTVDDTPALHPIRQKIAPFAEKAPLHALDVAHPACRKSKAGVEQNAVVVGQAPPEFCNVGGG